MSVSIREILLQCIKSTRKVDHVISQIFNLDDDDSDIQVEPKLAIETLEELIDSGDITNKDKAQQIIKDLSKKRDRENEDEEYEQVDSASESSSSQAIEDAAPDRSLAEDCQVLETLCRVVKALRKDDAVFCARVRENIKTATEHLLDPPADKPVILTERIYKFFPGVNPTQDQIFEIGRQAKIYYVKKYGEHPPKIERTINGEQISVNSYTEKTAPKTLDRAIQETFRA